MPIRKIKFVKNQYYHIFNRGVNACTLFLSDDHYQYCCRLLIKNIKRFHVSVPAYCLMPNHYHFVAKQNHDSGIQKCFQNTFNSYTQAFNKQQGRTGPLYQGRFKGILIDKDEVLMHVCRYIHLNPVRAGLVKTPGTWPYSNYLYWVNGGDSELFDSSIWEMFFRSGPKYKNFVLSLIEEHKAKKISDRFYMDRP